MNEAVLEKTETGSMSAYEELCRVADIMPASQALSLSSFQSQSDMADRTRDERITAALQVFVDMVAGDTSSVERVDKALIDRYIERLDEVMSDQLDQIYHDQQMQTVESAWRGLKYTVERTDFKANIKIEIMDVDKDTLREDFEDSPDATQCGLYTHIYKNEYDTPGGEPVSSIISNYEFDAGSPDVCLLREIAKVSAAALCPFIGAVGSNFFKKGDITDVSKMDDLTTHMEQAEYIRWNGFRTSEDSRYVGLTLPRFLLRLPYGSDNPVKSFNYQEKVSVSRSDDYLWGNAGFAFAANMTRSFKKYGWLLNIRGPEAGGKVEALPIHQFDAGRGVETTVPSETLIPETRELEFANLGFIPLSYYKNSDFACFFSASSTQLPQEYMTSEATANSRINSRLPYVFLSSRLGHYLKVLQRENIGSSKNAQELEDELNTWLQTLVTKMNNPGPELAATHPLREGRAIVEPVNDNPGFYKVSLYAIPHFQVEGMDVSLKMVAQMPRSVKG